LGIERLLPEMQGFKANLALKGNAASLGIGSSLLGFDAPIFLLGEVLFFPLCARMKKAPHN
jgi:hypothetical protein